MFGLFKKAAKPESTGHFQAEAAQILNALGGANNIEQVSACITRLRVTLKALSKADSNALKALGAAEVITVGSTIQAIFGAKSAEYATELKQLLKAK